MLLTFVAGFDPISLAVEAVIFSVLSTAGVSTAIALAATPVIATGLALGALYAVGTLLAPKVPDFGGGIAGNSASASVNPTNARSTFSSAEGAELRAVGRVRIGGLKIFGDTAGDDRYRLTAHLKGPIDAFEEYFFAGRSITVDDDGSVSSYPWSKLGGSWAFVFSKKGDGAETAWSQLTADFAGLWTSDHRVRGIAQSLSKYVNPGLGTDKFLQLYQGGVPDLSSTVRAELAYDPRTAMTAWTENGIINALHILRSSYRGITLDIIDTDFISAEADRADALVASRAGNVARSRCWGVWSSETARGDIMQKALDSIGAWIVPRANGAKLGIQLIDDDPSAEFAIPLKHILDIDWGSGPQGVERPNVCRVKYYSPQRNFAVDDIAIQAFDTNGNFIGPAWARVQDEVDAYGEKYFDVELPFCPDAGQAQRIARRMFLLARADSGVIRTNLAGLAAWGCRVGTFEFPDDLGTLKCQIGTPRIIDKEGQVEIPFAVWPSLPAWNTATDEVAAPDQIPDLAFGSPLTQPGQPISAGVIQNTGGFVSRVHYVVPGDATIVEAVYRPYSGGLPGSWASMTEFVGATGWATASAFVDLRGIKCDFRLRTFDADDNGSSWSEIFTAIMALSNTSPGDPVLTVEYLGGLAASGTIRVTARGPQAINLATLIITGSGMPGLVDCRPDEAIITDIVRSSGTYGFTAVARASDGTASATISASVTIPPGVPTLTAEIIGGVVRVSWVAPDSPNTSYLVFEGPGAPTGNQSVLPAQGGSFDVSLGSGSYTWTARAFASDGAGGETATALITIGGGT